MNLVRTRPHDPRLLALLNASPNPYARSQCLPSGDAAMRLVHGEPGAVPEVVGATAIRTGLAAAGLAIVGLRGKLLITGAIGAAVAIEVGVLLWAWYNKQVRP
jgi:hypothetical protein